jgi:hypothetical protein
VLLRLAALAAAAVALTACGGGGGTSSTASDDSLAPGCEVAVMGRSVRAFLAAISSGDRAKLDRRLSPADDFVRLTVIDPEGRRFSTADRGKALDYLAARHAQNESLRVLQLRVARGVDANHDTVTGSATRVAADVGRDLVAFDGAVDCVHGSISRWRLRPSAG